MIDGGSDKPPDGLGCKHYWVIQPAMGPVSQGLCQTCGQTREFKNYVGADTWQEERKRRYETKKPVAVQSEDEEAWQEEHDEYPEFDPEDREIALVD